MYQNYRWQAFLLCFCVFMLFAVFSSRAQVIAGIRANGRIMLHGDTINVCKGSSINYLSAAQGSLNIFWRFNSGNPSTATGIGPFPVTYNNIGYDTTFQKVVGGAFADSTYIIVHVTDIFPTAGYTFSPDNVCGNEYIQFSNTSATGDPLSFIWNFADGSISGALNPSHQFLSAVGMPGTQVFPVKLLVTNVYGCKDSITRNVTVKKVPDAAIGNADPLVNFGPFNGMSTFKKCNNISYYNFKFNNQSTTLSNNISYTIHWGEGSPDSTFASWPVGQVISHNFPLGGSTMVVNVTGADGCIGIKKYVVFLGTIPAGGLASLGNTDICSSDSLRFLITNIENNPPGTTYSFLINDGTSPQVFVHPPPTTVAHHFDVGSCLFSSNNGINTYTNAFGAYLTIENPCGSNSASVVPIYVSGKPRPAIYLPTPVVCVNTVVNISNASSYGNVINQTGTFTSECLNNGTKVWKIIPSTGYNLISGVLGSLNGNSTNGAVWTDGSNALNVQFLATGTYTIKLYIYNDRCGIDSTIRTICVRNPPQASFTMSQHSSCTTTTMNLVNTSGPGGCQGDDYNWIITYSDPQNCAGPGTNNFVFANGTNANSASPFVTFNKVGKYVIRLTVKATNSPYGCPEQDALDSFYVKGPPVASMATISNICANNSINPSASTNNCYAPGPFGYQWTFTNGTPNGSTNQIPGNIIYTNTGVYPVQLIVIDSSCMLRDTVVNNITVTPPPVAEAGNNASLCSGTAVAIGMNPVAGVSYQWSPAVGLSNAAIANPTANLSYAGPSADTVFTFYLTASTGINCSNIDSVKITVKRKPVIAIDPVSPQICFGNSINLTAGGADSYSWSPTIALTNYTTNTVIATPLVTTTYTVVGTLANGCIDTKAVTVVVHPDADANFITGDTTRCSPVNIDSLINNIAYPAGNGMYNWYANNLLFSSTSSAAVPSYVITQPGDTVTIKLVTLSPYGCKPDSIQRTFITRPSVTAYFTKDRDSSCAPLNVLFTNASNVLNGVQFFWNFGNGITTTAVQPGTIGFGTSPAFRDTTYHIVLKEYNGCDTSYHFDSVKVFANSRARFAVDTARGCSPFTIHIQNTSLGNNFSYYWDFGDGSTDTTHTIGSFTHTYYTGIIRNYTIRLISENRCTRDTQIMIIVVNPITIQPLIAAYGNQQSGCAPHLATFNNSSVGAAQLTWNFGDSSPPVIIPNSQNTINHLYSSPGNYTVTIRLQNDCSDTTVQRTIVVYDPPIAAFNVAPLRVCKGQPVTVNNVSQNANAYQWNWGDGSTSTFSNGQHVYNDPGSYSITLVAQKVQSSGFICSDTVTREIIVVDKIPAQIITNADKFCAPYTLNVSAGNITGYDYIEWVIYDSSTAQGEFHLQGSSATHVYNRPGSYSVKLIVHTTTSCADSSVYPFRVYSTPQTSFGPQMVSTCSHDTLASFTATTTNNGNDPVNYKWFVNGSIEGTNNPFNHRFQAYAHNSAPEEFLIRALAQNLAGCGDTSFVGKLIIQPLPWPHIEVSPSLVLQQPDYKFTFKDVIPPTANKTWTWYMGDRTLQTKNGREITYEYGDTGNYKVKLVVTDFATGCKAADSVKVTVLYVPGYLYVPNAMCLGCSNYSLRQFLPLAKGLKTYHLRVYNNWGQIIFETTKLDANGSPSEPWDGKYRGQVLQQDVYSWQIEGTYINGTEWKGMLYPGSSKYEKAGFITVIK